MCIYKKYLHEKKAYFSFGHVGKICNKQCVTLIKKYTDVGVGIFKMGYIYKRMYVPYLFEKFAFMQGMHIFEVVYFIGRTISEVGQIKNRLNVFE